MCDSVRTVLQSGMNFQQKIDCLSVEKLDFHYSVYKKMIAHNDKKFILHD